MCHLLYCRSWRYCKCPEITGHWTGRESASCTLERKEPKEHMDSVLHINYEFSPILCLPEELQLALFLWKWVNLISQIEWHWYYNRINWYSLWKLYILSYCIFYKKKKSYCITTILITWDSELRIFHINNKRKTLFYSLNWLTS